MLAPLLWLSPVAQDVLGTVSELMKGEVPCAGAKLAAALKGASDDQCQGLLKDAGIRKELAAKIDFEVSDKSAGKLVAALGAVLEAQVKAIKGKTGPVVQGLAKKGTPELGDVEALMPKGQEVSNTLRFDYVLWHGVGSRHSPKLMPELDAPVVHDRLATAAFAGDGPAAATIVAFQVLENLDKYVAWEASMAGSKPMTLCREVHTPFDDKMCKEVALRRVLATVISPEAATAAAAKAGGKPMKVLEEMAAAVSAAAIIPLYVAPPAAKEPKDKAAGKENKGKEGGKDKAAPKADGGAKAGPAGSFGKMQQATATQELQWALLNYQLRRCTTLGAAAAGGYPAGGAASGARGGKKASAARPAGFGAIWYCEGNDLPPGHTEYSWNHEKAIGMCTGGLVNAWTPVGNEKPPGHTDYSWEKMIGDGGAAAAPSSSASKAKPAGKAAAPAAKAAAPAKSGDGPAEGSIEEDLCKLDLRCGKIIECGRAPGSDNLYLLKVDVGEDKPRQVVSSLVKHYKEDQLKDRQVVVYCNIKPGKLVGLDSEAMVLAATIGKGTDDEKCELLMPPKGTKEGTRAKAGNLEAGTIPQNVKNISKVWGRVQPLLLTTDKCEATFNNIALTMGGPITGGSCKGAPIY